MFPVLTSAASLRQAIHHVSFFRGISRVNTSAWMGIILFLFVSKDRENKGESTLLRRPPPAFFFFALEKEKNIDANALPAIFIWKMQCAF